LSRTFATARCRIISISPGTKRRWQIEEFFKTAKHRFGQGTRQGLYRWIVLSFLAFILAYWAHLAVLTAPVLDWGAAAQAALEGGSVQWVQKVTV